LFCSSAATPGGQGCKSEARVLLCCGQLDAARVSSQLHELTSGVFVLLGVILTVKANIS